MVSSHCCLAGLAKCTRLYDPPPVKFSIATRIAEEIKRKFLLLSQRCGGGVRFLGDGRRSIVNDVVQGFHVDTRLVRAALVRSLLLLLHHPCLWSSQGPDLSNWSFQHILCQDLQPLLTLRSPEILCWVSYKPLSDENHEPDWNLSSSQDANRRPISCPTMTISRTSSSSSSSRKNRRKKTRRRRWRRRRRWGPTYLHEYLGVQFMHWSAHKNLQKTVNNTTSSSSMGKSGSRKQKWGSKLRHWTI